VVQIGTCGIHFPGYYYYHHRHDDDDDYDDDGDDRHGSLSIGLFATLPPDVVARPKKVVLN
jgi:hypothetical protein